MSNKKFVRGQKVKVRVAASAPGKTDGGLWEAVFLEYVGDDQCRVKWPHWGTGFSPDPVVDLDDVSDLNK
jgi:hypothetical protein